MADHEKRRSIEAEIRLATEEAIEGHRVFARQVDALDAEQLTAKLREVCGDLASARDIPRGKG